MVFFVFFFFFNGTATTGIYTYLHTLSLHDALPISRRSGLRPRQPAHNNMHPYPRHPARRGRSPDLRQGFDGLAIAPRNGVAVAVMAVDDHAFAADHHFAHPVAVAAEDPAVGAFFAGGAGEAGRGGVAPAVVVAWDGSGPPRA